MTKPTRLIVAATAAAGCIALLVTLAARFTGTPEVSPDPPLGQVDAPSELKPPVPRERRGVYPYGRVVAVTIGIDRYPNLAPPRPLKQAESDAKQIGEALARQFGYEVVPLLGPDATASRIWETLDRYAAELGQGDALIVFFAGHGQVVELPGRGDAGYLVPYEAALDIENGAAAARWEKEAVSMSQLVEKVDRARAGHALIIADACCSGFLTASRGALRGWDLKRFLVGRSRVVLAATTRDQNARDGTFTKELVGQLRRLDDSRESPKAASVYDLFYALLKDVSAISEGKMTPQVAQVGDGDGMFVFVPASAERAELEKDLREIEKGLPPTDGPRTIVAALHRRKAQLEQSTTPDELDSLLDAAGYRGAPDAEARGREWEQRFERFRRNALAGDLWATAALCVCYEKGLGVAKDPAQAYQWARLADRVRFPAGVGRYLLGRCYETGIGTPVGGRTARERAKRLYAESAAAGFGPGKWASALVVLSGAPNAAQARAAAELLEQAASEGVLPAKVSLATVLLSGSASPGFDSARAVRLLEEAARSDNERAHHILYDVYASGRSGYPPKDIERAGGHLRRAVELGWPGAIVDLGLQHHRGPRGRLGLSVNHGEAFRLFCLAADMDHPDALVICAQMLADGQGTERDAAGARESLDRAVKLGEPVADWTQGLWYAAGKVYRQSDEVALEAFLRGAEKGHPNCCYEAGVMYLEGRGFKVKNARKDGSFHDDWHRGLHYFVLAHQSGVLSDVDLKTAGAAISRYVDFLEGGSFSKDLDKRLKEMKRGPYDSGFQRTNGNKTGERGQRRPVQFDTGGGTAATVAGDLIARANVIGATWRRVYPDSFQLFCDKWGVDPQTLEITNKHPGDAARKK